MKRKLLYIAIIMALTAAMIFAAGCKDRTETAAPQEETKETAEALKYDSSEFLDGLPEWDGTKPYCEINGNVPEFTKDEIWTTTQESLSPLDSLGRCGTANSCIGTDGMPDQPRGNISEIEPTGWHTDKYDGIPNGNLYNRSHLIAHKLSGDDAVDRNLITGTSYMNQIGMDEFENRIYRYVKDTGNHVMYRVEPCFRGDELVARGVHMQAVSVEGGGEGLSFNVFCYNVQPGIEIDYATGDSRLIEKEDDEEDDGTGVHTYVLNTYRMKFHKEDCQSALDTDPANRKVVEATREELIEEGYKPCGNCDP